MEIRVLQYEISDAERLAERGKIILDLFEQLNRAKSEIESLHKIVEDLRCEKQNATEVLADD